MATTKHRLLMLKNACYKNFTFDQVMVTELSTTVNEMLIYNAISNKELRFFD